MTEMWLGNEDDSELVNLAAIEPWCYHVEGKPVTRVTYAYNTVTIEWATQEVLDKMRDWFDD